MKCRLILFIFILNNVTAEDKETRTVILEDGGVVGTKYWNGDFFEFYGIPYAEAPTGHDRYQAPLPVKPWKDMLSASSSNIVCHQSYFTDDDNDDFVLSGEDDCLVINLFVPKIASEENLVPVVVYIHSGAFAGGNGNMARFHYLARHDIIVISFNYRLGAIGFACLGNKEIPGNAGLKDQVAALKWIKKNVKKFGGDPNKITLAGYSVGASMAELLALSKTTDGLIDQLILDSGSALSPFAINRDPVSTAKNLAFAMGYNGTGSLEDLTEFYLEAPVGDLAKKSLNFFLGNSTFGFSPCIENFHRGITPVITESPMDVLKKGKNPKIPMLIGFGNMEGISRLIRFGDWRERMTKDFSEFLPADLEFDTDKSRNAVIEKIKNRYFKGHEVNHEKVQGYVDYFSDAMFKYAIIKSLRLHAAVSKRRMYLYEFTYIGKLNMQHNYMDKIKGASHRDQTAYILDFYGWTNSYKDLEMRDRMTMMWADFVKYGDPTAYESAVVNYKWLPYTNENQNYLQIGRKPSMKNNLFAEGFDFWNKLYEKHYWNPTAPKLPKVKPTIKKEPEIKTPVKKTSKNKIRNKDLRDEDGPEKVSPQTQKEEVNDNSIEKEDNHINTDGIKDMQEKHEILDEKTIAELEEKGDKIQKDTIEKTEIVKEKDKVAQEKIDTNKEEIFKDNIIIAESLEETNKNYQK